MTMLFGVLWGVGGLTFGLSMRYLGVASVSYTHLDEILAEELPNMKSCLEAKLFGIGLEAYTVGSHDFYAGYGAKNNVIYTLDTGHYEPTENVSDAVSALLLFVPELMLHVSDVYKRQAPEYTEEHGHCYVEAITVE